jgi:endonuclease/exonuclease/phosphatase family metal-dependent hydrolase
MKRFMLASVIASMLGIAGAASAAPAPGIAGDIEVMTQNQYLGADIAPLIAAIQQGPEAFNAAVIKALTQISANQTPERVKYLAGQILQRQPHLVGLQEVWEFSCFPDPSAKYNPCDVPLVARAFSNHLDLTKAALGSAYQLEAVVQNFTATVPFTFDGTNLAYVSVKDRDAIFARSDIAAKTDYYALCDVPSPSGKGCNYDARLNLGPLPPVTRGFVAVTSEIGGKNYLFVNTHLEVEEIFNFGDPVPIQSQQADELIDVIEDQEGFDRLVLVGDMNSSPNDAAFGAPTPYTKFQAADLVDAWLVRPGNVAGLSCCQLEDLSNRPSLLTRRIDLILSREPLNAVKDARLIGAVAADRLAPPGKGLWPSDHASVAAGLRY